MSMEKRTVAPTTDMHNVLMSIAVIEHDQKSMRERLESMDEKLDERMASLHALHSERQEVSRLFITHTVATAVEAAVKTHVAPLSAEVQKLREEKLEDKAVMRTSVKAATLVGGALSVIISLVLKLFGA